MLCIVNIVRAVVRYLPRQGIWMDEAIQEEVHIILVVRFDQSVIDGKIEAEKSGVSIVVVLFRAKGRVFCII
jgi:hypothetical protein